ncbi:MAG: hypothetical protein ABSG83_12640, partial [Roseiarcus sp.]
MGRLGPDPSAPFVTSRRSSKEKKPWKDLAGIENRVEAEFLRPVLLGESILPHRVFRTVEGVVPVTGTGAALDAEAAALRGYDGVHGWMRKSEAVWKANAENGSMTLIERWNYHNELSIQFPLAPLRVVYAASGTNPCALVLKSDTAAIEHGIYWTAPKTLSECYFLAAVLNSETARERGVAYQARGQWGARHFDKVVFNLPIPRFDPKHKVHAALAKAAAEAEAVAAAVELPESVKFQRARGLVRAALVEAGIAQRIDALVAKLLDG